MKRATRHGIQARRAALALLLVLGAASSPSPGASATQSSPATPVRTVKQKTSETCTTVIIGKGLSENGSILHAHNEDLWYDTAQNLLVEPARSVDPSAMEAFYSTQLPYGVTRTLAFMGAWNADRDEVPGDLGLGMNEAGVMITTNTAHARPEEMASAGRPATFVYSDFMRLALERATTSLDAVKLMGGALESQGLRGDPGIIFFVSDPREAWVLEATPLHWVASQVPENGYVARANQYGITDAGELRSANLVSDAVARGFYAPADPARPERGFDFRAAYGDPAWNEGENVNYNRPREHYIEDYLGARLALSGRVSAADLMTLLRSHLDTTAFEAPPPHARYEEVDSTGDSVPRTICTARTVLSIVSEQDASRPAGLAAKWWTAFPAPCTTAFFPIYLSHVGEAFPQDYANARADGGATPDTNAWWAYAALLRAVDNDDARRRPVVRAAYDALEASAAHDAPFIEESAAALYAAGQKASADDLLNGFTDYLALDSFAMALDLRAQVEGPP